MHHAHATFASTSCDQASPSTSLPHRQPHLFSLLTGIPFHRLHQFPYSHLSSKFYNVFVSKAINSSTASLAHTLDLRFRRYRRLQCGTAGNGFWRLISYLLHFLFPIAFTQGPHIHPFRFLIPFEHLGRPREASPVVTAKPSHT